METRFQISCGYVYASYMVVSHLSSRVIQYLSKPSSEILFYNQLIVKWGHLTFKIFKP